MDDTTRHRSWAARWLAPLAGWLARHRGPRSLKLYLMALPLAGGLPILVFVALLLLQLQAIHRQKSNADLRQEARGIAFAISGELTNAVQILQVLAQSHALTMPDYAAFYGEAQLAAERAGGHILLLDKSDFNQILNTIVPFGIDLPPTSALEIADRVVRERRPIISDIFFGAVSQKWVYNVEVPVIRDDAVRYVLVLSFGVDHLLPLLQGAPHGSSSWAVLVDGAGRVVAHSADQAARVGQPFNFPACGDDVVIAPNGFAGNDVASACATLSQAGWTVLARETVSELDKPYRRTWDLLLATGGLFITLALLLAVTMSRRITEPMARLSSLAARVGAGEIVPAETTDLREVNAVAQQLAVASRLIAEARATEARLSALTVASGEAIYRLSPRGVIETWNLAAERLFGYAPDEIIGQSIDLLTPEDCVATRDAAYEQARNADAVTFETLRRRKDGRQFDVAITAAPLREIDGSFAGFVSVARDISERKAWEQELAFLMRELSHRTKNLLAVVLSVARHTGRNASSLSVFEERFTARLLAMAQTHDLLVSRDWQAAGLEQIISGQLTTIAIDTSEHIEMNGPEILVQPSAAEAIGLAVHELAVNATKHGSLSTDAGRVRIAWETIDAPDAPRFAMSWTEEHGPLVEPPDHRGFGHTVIKDMLEYRLQGTVTLAFAAAGFRWRLEAPLQQVTVTPAALRRRPWRPGAVPGDGC